jgi:hypothetical protein
MGLEGISRKQRNLYDAKKIVVETIGEQGQQGSIDKGDLSP